MSDKMNNSCHNKVMPKIERGMWRVGDHTQGEGRVEELMFMMRDKYHEFSLGLSTVLKYLAIAEREGYAPPLSDDWWLQIRQVRWEREIEWILLKLKQDLIKCIG